MPVPVKVRASFVSARLTRRKVGRNMDGESMRPTRLLSWRDPASRMQPRIRWTAHLRQEAPRKTSPDRPGRSFVRVGRHELDAARAAVLDRAQEAEHESYDSVSTTDRPSTCRQPPSSQPIAVTTAVEQTRRRATGTACGHPHRMLVLNRNPCILCVKCGSIRIEQVQGRSSVNPELPFLQSHQAPAFTQPEQRFQSTVPRSSLSR